MLHEPPGQSFPEGGIPSTFLVSMSWSVDVTIGLKDLMGGGSS